MFEVEEECACMLNVLHRNQHLLPKLGRWTKAAIGNVLQ